MDDYPLLNLFWTMLWLFLWILWFFLLFKVISDIFRSHDMSGWGKAGWLIFVILLPFLGVLVYLIARGHSMSDRDLARAQQGEAAFREYVREAAAPSSGTTAPDSVEALSRLADLRSSGALTEDEFQKAKAKFLA